jgi:hypothetical protein
MPMHYENRALRAYIDSLPRRGDDTAADIADEWKLAAYQRAPVSDNPPPGHTHMRDRLEIEDVGNGKRILRSPASYSGFVEFSTRNQSAQPWFVPGREDARKLMSQIARERLKP